jgi:hypothetical protein
MEDSDHGMDPYIPMYRAEKGTRRKINEYMFGGGHVR